MRQNTRERLQEAILPRLIVWQLPSDRQTDTDGTPPLSQHERLLILDSIARVAKPIVVLRGMSVIRNDDILEIVGYGHALNLKMIVELQPEELTQNIIDRYRIYGVRIFRLSVDGRINEDADTRFRQSQRFLALERAVDLLKLNGFEVHLSLTITDPDHRLLAYILDYAYLRRAKGLYCHLGFVADKIRFPHGLESADVFLLKIPDMKEMMPYRMYISPQCVRYSVLSQNEPEGTKISGIKRQWIPICLAGRTFGFIDAFGKLRFCPCTENIIGDLRSHGCDFRSLWNQSEIFCAARLIERSCSAAHLFVEEYKSHKKPNQLVVHENAEDLK